MIGFYTDPGGYYTNYRGQNEKYLRGKSSWNDVGTYGGDYWYYSLPNGNLYEFAPPYSNAALTGYFLGNLGTAIYNDPSLLTNAVQPSVGLSFSGSQMAITPAPTYTGVFQVTLTVSDGKLHSLATFNVTVS